jgi:hypothetical protein
VRGFRGSARLPEIDRATLRAVLAAHEVLAGEVGIGAPFRHHGAGAFELGGAV